MQTQSHPSPESSSSLQWMPDVHVDGACYQRAVAQTEWIRPGNDLGAVMVEHLGASLQPGDVVIVSEKAVIISNGLGVPVEQVKVGRLARWLAAAVRPTEGSRGLSIPEKMACVLQEAGVVRILSATLVAGLTRPLGIRGGFYVVAGRAARAMDGMRPPFEHLLLPSLPPALATEIARDLADRVGAPVTGRGGARVARFRDSWSGRRGRRGAAGRPGHRGTPVGAGRARGR